MTKVLLLMIFLLLIFGFIFRDAFLAPHKAVIQTNQPSQAPSPIPSPSPTLPPLPSRKILESNYQVFQSFNNCGPASLSMTLSYFGIHKTQVELGNELRPYQVPFGDNDDKSVTLDELAAKAEDYNLLAYHRPNGGIELIKEFIASDIPVLTRTLLHENEDIGHYRVIKGYDDLTQEIVQDDSLEGRNIHFSYREFNSLWEKFNYEYLVIVPKDRQRLAEQILGSDLDLKASWRKAAESSIEELEKNPQDIYVRFNLSVAYYNSGQYQKSVEEYEKVESKLPFRTLWYQIEPIESYYELGDYQRVFEITQRVINNQNRAYSEAYFLRGQSYLKLGDKEAAKIEFEKAVFYNQSFKTRVPVV